MMQTVSFTALLLVGLGLSAADARAQAPGQNFFHPPRVRLILHGKVDVGSLQMVARFLPSGNLMNGLAPVLYAGVRAKPVSWLIVEMYGGWVFGPNKPMVSLTFNPKWKKWWAWTEVDVHIPTWGGYAWAQVQYQARNWVHVGVEYEGWGSYLDGSSWSHGGGPNVLFRLERFGLDVALHTRQLNGIVAQELFVRIHAFLFQ